MNDRRAAQMTDCDRLLTELDDKILEWQSAREAGEKDDASEREKAALKTAHKAYLGHLQRIRKYILAEGSEQEKDRFARLEHHSTAGKP
jgi:hypothetical protein